MANIWEKVLQKVVSPIVDKKLKEIEKENNLQKGMVTYANSFPLTLGETTVSQRNWTGGVSHSALRQFAVYYPVLRSAINYRKRQILQLDWSVAPKEVLTNIDDRKKMKVKSQDVIEFLKHPTGDKQVGFSNFISKILEDLLVLDAVAIYKRKKRGGGLYGYLPIDSATIELILNSDGTTPQPPHSAYMQRVNGQEITRLTTSELIYRSMNPRTESPYGLSPVETLVMVVTTALKLSSYNLSYLTEGNVPEGFVELPKEVASDPEQLKLWQEAWDAMFSGNPGFQRKIKFLPEGMKWHPTKKAEDLAFERFEKWLLLETASVMEVAPQAIGFQFDRGKGATESEWEIGKERGLYPTAAFLKEVLDQIIQDDLGHPDLQFVWTNVNPTNTQEEAKVFKDLVNTGAVSVDEWRIGEGLDPIGCPHYVMSPTGPIFVKDMIRQTEEEGATVPVSPFNPNNQNNPKPSPKEAQPKESPKETPPESKKADSDPLGGIQEKLQQISTTDVVEELKRWKKATINDLKLGRPFREFKTDVVDVRTQNLIKNGLKNVTSRNELDQLFSPFINQENQIVSAVLNLYQNINDTLNDYGK